MIPLGPLPLGVALLPCDARRHAAFWVFHAERRGVLSDIFGKVRLTTSLIMAREGQKSAEPCMSFPERSGTSQGKTHSSTRLRVDFCPRHDNGCNVSRTPQIEQRTDSSGEEKTAQESDLHEQEAGEGVAIFCVL